MFCQRNNFFLQLIILVFFAGIHHTHAAKQTKTEQQTFDITANYLLLDEKKGISKYQGNVYFKKGTLAIKADSVILFYEGNELTKALITGSPADVLHYPDNEARVHSQAKTMEYLVSEERLTLKGQAFVDQGDNHFSGETIEYDTRQRTITAAGKQNTLVNAKNSKNTAPNRRVHVIIGPSDEGNKPDASHGADETEKQAH